MKKLLIIPFFIMLMSVLVLLSSCNEKEEMLVTDRTDCYMSRFQVRGTDNYNFLADVSIGSGIDTVACTVTAVVKHGTDITRLKPNCSLAPEASITPSMGDWTDFSKPRQYTVISGDEKVRKTYTVNVTVQP